MRVQVGDLSLPNNSALARFLRMKLSGGYVVVAGATDADLGTLEQRVLATESRAALVPRNAEGTVRMVAAAAVALYATVYGAAGGKVATTANTNPLGVALEAATADGDEIEVLRFHDPTAATS